MGRKGRKGFNWKARQDNEDFKKPGSCDGQVSVELGGVEVLPSRKKKENVKKEAVPVKKRLTKKEKRRLQSIVSAKNKNAQFEEVLAKLAKVREDKEVLKHITSTAAMQSENRKRKRINEGSVAPDNKKMRVTESEPIKDESSDEESDSAEEENSGNSVELTKEVANEEINKEGSPIKSRQNEEKCVEKSDTSQKQNLAPTPSITKKEETQPAVSAESKPVAVSKAPKVHISLNRSEEIQKQRERLPVFMEEQMIMEIINENPVTIVCGETGSGKTTQIPQFLYEAGYAHANGIIGITQPRRVAAISMAKRVAEEMGLTLRDVSFQIRYDGTSTSDTKIKFMTDGVLLKEVQKDFELTKYSVIVLDEAHERSVYTDILIGLLSGIVRIREKRGNPLKLILMSATLRVSDFSANRRLYRIEPPVIEVKSRQFEVTLHFNRRTPENDYLGEAYKKVCKIHRKLPSGGVLVFVTSQQEVNTLCTKLRKAYPMKDCADASDTQKKAFGSKKQKRGKKGLRNLPKVDLDNFSSSLPADEDDEELDEMNEDFEDDYIDDDDLIFGDGSDDEDFPETMVDNASEPLYVLPLYSLLAPEKQAKVFQPPSPGCRLCVVATNVAETSITIPGIKYVVDTGKVKTKLYDSVTGVSTFNVTWISKASANQRMGRAGRTAPGHCYRLYSSAVFMDFEEFTAPEITRRPIDDLVLLMRDIGIDIIVNFPLPTVPPVEAIQTAEKNLCKLGALTKVQESKFKKGETVYRLTPLGRQMVKYPVAPAYAKMLANGNRRGMLPYVVIVVSALSVQEVLVEGLPQGNSTDDKDVRRQQWIDRVDMKKKWAGSGNSLLLGDVMVLVRAVFDFERAQNKAKFCEKYGLRHKAMIEIRKLRRQLTNTINVTFPKIDLALDPNLEPPNDDQARQLRQIVLAGLGCHIAKKIPKKDGITAEEAKKFRFAYQDSLLVDPVYIHPNSILYRSNCEYVVYQTVEETSSKMFIKGVTAVEADWLPTFVPSECHFSEPLKEPAPRYDRNTGSVKCFMTCTFGPQFWQLPCVLRDYPDDLECCKYFAQSFLDGSVFKKLKNYVPKLEPSPAVMTKPYACRVEKVNKFLNSLKVKEEVPSVGRSVSSGKNGFVFICNKTRLMEMWEKKPMYLMAEYCEWLPEKLHYEIESKWPPV